jgi:CheY-like chemotaxis protein
MIVDRDKEFRYFVANVLATRYTTVQAESGVEAVNLCSSNRPAGLIIGEDIGMFGPALLVKKLRAQPQFADARFLLVTANGELPATIAPATFDAVLKRTFVPEEFSAQFRQLYERPAIENEIGFTIVRQMIASAAQQAIGMMAHTDVSLMTDAEVAPVDGEIVAFTVLSMQNERSAARITLSCSPAVALNIAAKLLETDEASVAPEDSLSALGELINVIAGRVQGALVAGGGAGRFSLPDISVPATPLITGPDDIVMRFDSSARNLCFKVVLTPQDQTAAERLETDAALAASPAA